MRVWVVALCPQSAPEPIFSNGNTTDFEEFT